MSNLSHFTNKENIKLLWDVLLDELHHINATNKTLISNIRMVFESNIKPFTLKTNPNINLIELNKHFLSQVILAVNKLFPREQNIKRITITNEEVSEPYKIEDIQSSRQNDFEKELQRKRIDLENYMTLKKPKEFDFSDRESDEKITAMDSLVAEKMTQRNLEIEQFQNSNYNTTNIDPEQWLSSKETSVKVEKNEAQNNKTNRLKHISIDNNNNISLIKEKKVSWNDLESTPNIFQKLKKKQEDQMIIDEPNEQKHYIEQQSAPLPDVKQEPFVSLRNNITQNTPIIPTSEIIKQMNEMNTKIDNLYEMISKLTNNNL
jgi:hypothetical protein